MINAKMGVALAFVIAAMLGIAVEAGPAAPSVAKGRKDKLRDVIVLTSAPQGKKEFFINRNNKTSWYRAFGQCAGYDDNMSLATFDTPKQYNQFLNGIRTSGVVGDFWIGASKLEDTQFNFMLDSTPVTRIYNQTIDGVGDCLSLKVTSPFKVTWSAGDCGNANRKRFICSSNQPNLY